MTPASMMCLLVNTTLPAPLRAVPQETLADLVPLPSEVARGTKFIAVEEMDVEELRALLSKEWAEARSRRYQFYTLKERHYRAIEAWLDGRAA